MKQIFDILCNIRFPVLNILCKAEVINDGQIMADDECWQAQFKYRSSGGTSMENWSG